jgi:catechol 2,3-dioxygenase-like lactoylglutathione lyase family enzyme
MLKINRSAAAIPAQDIKRARSFYEQKLGLKPAEEQPDGGVFYEAGETMFFVFPSAGKASGDHTQLGLEVDDVESAANEVRTKGVKLEEYDYPEFKTKNGIADMGDGKGFWFKDTEGNLIAVMERVPAATSSTSRRGSTTSR